jgi:nicotinamidase-related amidase/type 1 glutamine amidotransferase
MNLNSSNIHRLALFALLALSAVCAAEDPSTFKFSLRSRIESEKNSGHYNVRWEPAEWDAKKTALVICDMWDKHWCEGATRRVAEMAPRMNELVVEARKRGALIVHAPSDTMDYYKDTPQFKLAQAAPAADVKSPLLRWRKLDPARESALPIDDSDGGCDCAPHCKNYKAWSHQIDAVKIEPGDAVTDTAQAYHLMRQRGIENVLVMGVHLNMCVLGRPFSIRQLVSQGLRVALVRDMIDTMYNPQARPFVSHFTGTDLMLQHVEKYWCPSISSSDIIGGKEFRFSEDTRPSLLIVTAEEEYKSDETLPEFALQNLGKDYKVSCVFGGPPTEHTLQGLEQLKDADALILCARRRILVKEQLDLIRKFVASGKPLIAIRTACHAFSRRGKDPLPADCDDWEHFDTEVLGCQYTNHYPADGQTNVNIVEKEKANPLLKGVEPFTSAGSLYKVAPLDAKAIPLLQGACKNNPAEYVAWALTRENGERIFCTTLGHPDDFKLPQFIALLVNGIEWAVPTKR